MQLEFQVCDHDLSNAVYQYLSAEAIAVDTETMGLLPHRDRVVQLCDPEGR